MKQADRTFVIPTVTNIEGLRRCIKSIYKYNEPGSFRIIVINNSEADLDKELRESVHLYIHPYYNLGFSKSCNLGMVLTQFCTLTPYVVLCNDDVEFINKKWWDGIMETFEWQEKINPKKVAMVNPASIMDRNEKPRIPYKPEYSEEDYQKLLDWKNPDGTELKNTVIDTICMWCPVIKMEVIAKDDMSGILTSLQIGYLREKFYPGGGEDYDFNRRAYMLNYRCIGTFRSWAWHEWGATKDSIPAKALPQKEGLRWNNFDEIWGKGADLFGRGGRQEMNPKDYKDITPL